MPSNEKSLSVESLSLVTANRAQEFRVGFVAKETALSLGTASTLLALTKSHLAQCGFDVISGHVGSSLRNGSGVRFYVGIKPDKPPTELRDKCDSFAACMHEVCGLDSSEGVSGAQAHILNWSQLDQTGVLAEWFVANQEEFAKGLMRVSDTWPFAAGAGYTRVFAQAVRLAFSKIAGVKRAFPRNFPPAP